MLDGTALIGVLAMTSTCSLMSNGSDKASCTAGSDCCVATDALLLVVESSSTTTSFLRPDPRVGMTLGDLVAYVGLRMGGVLEALLRGDGSRVAAGGGVDSV